MTRWLQHSASLSDARRQAFRQKAANEQPERGVQDLPDCRRLTKLGCTHFTPLRSIRPLTQRLCEFSISTEG